MLHLARHAARAPISVRIHFTTLAAVIGLMALAAVEVTGRMRDLEQGRVEVLRGVVAAADGIAARYPSVGELVRGLERDGPLALEDCRKCANSDGAFTDRLVGPAISKRMHKIFTGRDSGSMEV